MRLVLLDPTEQQALVRELGDLSAPVPLAEQLFAAISARGNDTRHLLCRRLARRLGALAPELDSIRQLLDVLIRQGDITSASGGQIAAAPIRAISLGSTRHLLRSSLPSARLEALLELEVHWSGLSRTVFLEPEQLASRLDPLGGVVLSAASWAGLDRCPPAGPGYLAILDARLPPDPVDLGIELASPWKSYQPAPDQPRQARRWRSPSPAPPGAPPAPGATGEPPAPGPRLWRARSTGGWWVFVWTRGQPPGGVSALRLRSTEAWRAAFSLDRERAPLQFRMRAEAALCELEIDALLPRPEHRYLTTIGTRLSSQWPALYQVPAADWPALAQTIHERLGCLLLSE